jgi:hypothetical protein
MKKTAFEVLPLHDIVVITPIPPQHLETQVSGCP